MPQQYSGMGTLGGVNKDCIADAIGRLNINLSVDDGQRSAASSGKAGGQRACDEISP